MNQNKYVFAQLIAFLNRNHFNYLVRKYAGDKYVKHFTCWNQLLTLMFGQLSNRESLRDLIVAIEAHYQKCYHLGLSKHVTRSNLAKANTNRDYRIFEEYAYYLVSEARRKRATDIFRKEVLMRYCKSLACHLLTQRISEISPTKLYSKMTKTEAVQVNLIYLIFKLVHF